MSSELADRLMRADSAEAFLAEQGGSIDWQVMAELKGEVDRLVGCDLNVAGQFAGRIEQLAELVGDKLTKAFAGASRGRVLHNIGNHSGANALYEAAAAEISTAGLAVEAALIQKHQVYTLLMMGRYEDALRTARAARRVLAHGSSLHLAQLETSIGNIYYQRDRYRVALQHYEQARRLLPETGHELVQASVDFNRANVLTETDRPEDAVALLETASSLFDNAGHALQSAQARFHIAYIQFLRGNYNTALTSYYELRDRLAELGSLQLVAYCNLEMAEILLALNAFEDASECALLARSRFGELGMPYDAARAVMVHALAQAGAGKYEEAQSSLAEAREIFERIGNVTYVAFADSHLAELAIRRGHYDEAANRADAAQRTFSRQKLHTKSAYSRLISARAAYYMGNRTKSLRMARLSLRAVERLFAPTVVFQCHQLIGRIERDRGQRPAALADFRRAVEVIEQMRGGIAADEFKATFLRDKIEVYEDAINACLDEETEESLQDAFQLVESAKSRALADLVARYLRGAPAGTPDSGAKADTRAQLLRVIEELNWYSSRAGLEDDKGNQRNSSLANRHRREVRRCEKQIAQLFHRLEAEGSDFADIQFMQPATASDLCSGLERGETAIEYFITGDEVSAFVATSEGVQLKRGIASKRDVEQVLSALRFQIEKFNFGSIYVDAYFGQLKRVTDDHLARLFGLVFAPIAPLIDSERVVVIPHGALHYVPFHALRDGGNYLVDRFEISYAPSAAVLKLCRARRSQKNGVGKGMVALGVTHRHTPHIADEIREIGSLFPDSVSLIGESATRENLFRFAPEARFLHLASHGYFRRDNPMFSFLKLADSPLNFYSLLDLKLRAEMVTLSACHTGVNTVFPGDELHGLMRGFLYAGAPTVVASLWAVSDSSTAEFMGEMYSRIRAGETKRQALRSAQLKIKDDYGHPYYWAPFVLMGNPT